MNKYKESELHTSSSCKNSWEIKKFLQELINKELIQAYHVEIDKSMIESDIKRERVVRTIKGASLEPITDIHPGSGSGSYFFQDMRSPIIYNVEIDMKISNSDFEDLEHKYGHLDITRIRLSKKTGLEDIGEMSGRFDIPDSMITGGLYYSWNHDIRNQEHHEKSGYLRIKGIHDDFFSKIEKFVSE